MTDIPGTAVSAERAWRSADLVGEAMRYHVSVAGGPLSGTSWRRSYLLA